MTVQELIEKLLECNMPDAEVAMVANSGDRNQAAALAAIPVDSVFYDETLGPVFLEGFLQTDK